MKKLIKISLVITAIGVAVKVVKKNKEMKRIDSGTINTKKFKTIKIHSPKIILDGNTHLK